MKKACLITGATGAIGPCIVRTFHEAGFRIRTLSLDPAVQGTFPADVDERIGDITDISAVQSAVRDCEIVIHLAARLHLLNHTTGFSAEYRRVNCEGTAAVVSASMQSNISRIVLFSTISVYGDSGGRTLTEESPPRPVSDYALTKLEAEKIVLDARRPSGPPLGTVLRLAAVYGPRVKGNYLRLLRALAGRRFVPVGKGTNRRTLIYEEDVARAALSAATHPSAAGRLYNVTDGCLHTMNEIVLAICEALGRRPPRFHLPARPVRGLAVACEEMARCFKQPPPISRSAIDKYTEDLAISGRRIHEELQFVPKWDLRTGWQQTVHELRASGAL